MPSPFPGAEDTWVDKVDGVSLDHADDVNGAWHAVIATQHAQGVTGDTVTAATHQGRLKYQEAGGLKRGADVTSATTIAVADTAQVFRLTGTTNVATITAPTYPRLVYFEVVNGLTFVHGTGNLTLPGATNLAVPAGAVLALEWTGTTWYVAGSAGSGDASTILTIPIEAGPPTIGDILQYDGTHWALHAIIEAIPVDPVAATAGLRTLGTGAQQAVSGTDARLTNARPPTAHSLSHVTVGQDPLDLFTATTRGLVPPPGGTPVGARYMTDIGTFTDPAILAGGMSDPMTAEDDIMVGDVPTMGVAAPKRLARGADGEYLGIDPADHHLKYIAAPGRHIIYDETTPVQNEPVIAFQGAGVAVTDDSLDGATIVTIPGGLSNPMSAPADIIVGGTSGVPARLAKGSDGDVLTVDPTTHLLVWAAPSGGSGNATSIQGAPVAATTPSNGDVLTYHTSGTPGWAPAAGGGGGGGSVSLTDIIMRGQTRTAPPVASTWTLNNLALAPGTGNRVDDHASGLILWADGQVGDNFGHILESMPGGSWSRTAVLMAQGPARNWGEMALVIRESSTGKFLFSGLYVDDTGFFVYTFNCPGNGGGGSTVGVGLLKWDDPVLHIKVSDNGTNFKFEVSRAGQANTWVTVYDLSRTNYLSAPDQVGLTISAHTTSIRLSMIVASYG